MFKTPHLPCLLCLTLLFSACEDGNPAPPPESDILKEAVIEDSKQKAELQKETDALKAKREEAKAELEKIRREAASLNERLDALQKGDLAKASSGNTEDAATARLASPAAPPGASATASEAKARMENQLITFNLKSLCELADARMDLDGKKTIAFDDLVGPGKTIKQMPSVAGEIYDGLVFTPQKKIYQVTTLDGRTVSYERGK